MCNGWDTKLPNAGTVTGTYTMETVMDKDVVFRFLNDLRTSGRVNMFGSGVYLQEVFGVDRNEANELVAEWMRSFDACQEGKVSV